MIRDLATTLSQIRDITVSYFQAMDSGNFPKLEEVFERGRVRAPLGLDGVWVSPEREDPFDWSAQAVETFREAVLLYDDGTPRTCHFTTNLHVCVDEDQLRATATSRFTVLQALSDFELQPIVAGRYMDSFERVDGRWFLVDRFEDSMIWGDPRFHLTGEALVDVRLGDGG